MNFIQGYPRFNLGFFKYLLWLFKEIVVSTIDVLKIIWSRGDKPSGCFDTIKTEQNSPLGYTVLGNSITLTPGTVTVKIDDHKNQIIVHALGQEGLAALHEGEMDKRVLKAVEND